MLNNISKLHLPSYQGRYCEESTVTPIKCGAGKYNPNYGGSSDAACVACPAGSFCDGVEPASVTGPCTAGWFCAGGATTGEGTVCPAGSYCESGSAGTTPCPAGTYNPNTGQLGTFPLLGKFRTWRRNVAIT